MTRLMTPAGPAPARVAAAARRALVGRSGALRRPAGPPMAAAVRTPRAARAAPVRAAAAPPQVARARPVTLGAPAMGAGALGAARGAGLGRAALARGTYPGRLVAAGQRLSRPPSRRACPSGPTRVAPCSFRRRTTPPP